MKTTVTEALAELKTLEKRINKKLANVQPYVFRQEALRDPLEQQGGSRGYIEKEIQSMEDLQEHRLALRRAIQVSNENTDVAVLGETRTIADWLMWRREALPQKISVYTQILRKIEEGRREAEQRGCNISTQDSKKFGMDFVVNVDEIDIREMLDKLENIDGTLDGKLSLKNAVTVIEL